MCYLYAVVKLCLDAVDMRTSIFYKKKANFDLRRIKGQTSLLRSTRKVNTIVTVISCLILTARAMDVIKFPINM